MVRGKLIVNMKMLPGEPLNSTGRVCIHLFLKDAKGPFVESHVMYPVLDEQGKPTRQLAARPTRGRLACDPQRVRSVAPVVHKGVTTITHRTDDPRAVTCPKCMATAEYKEMIEAVGGDASLPTTPTPPAA